MNEVQHDPIIPQLSPAQLRKLSKFLSLLLRHHPEKFPLKLDEAGYADLAEIMRILRGLPNFRWATRSNVDAVLALPGRQRFEIVAGNGIERIRALYGHSAVRPEYEAVTPPNVLFHGTAPDALENIFREGLKPMARQYVHLAVDEETAHGIASRHTSTPVILRVDAAAAHAAGIEFYHPTASIYLVEILPPAYLFDDSKIKRE
ncbi:MAG: RNA 2'-phosphotransferase [Anaerolineae bacterium]|nr:RNA 2'-phosphotransferase [Anaerolineae bacterium]